jgi:hypothetical protein
MRQPDRYLIIIAMKAPAMQNVGLGRRVSRYSIASTSQKATPAIQP